WSVNVRSDSGQGETEIVRSSTFETTVLVSRIPTASLTHSSQRNRPGWAWGSQSVDRSFMHMAERSRRRHNGSARSSRLPFRFRETTVMYVLDRRRNKQGGRRK